MKNLNPAVVLVAVGCVLVAVTDALGAQATAIEATAPQTFEVASVKTNTSGSIVVNQSISGGRYTGTNLSVMDMLATIYMPLPRSHILGGPDWMRTDRFDIVAKGDGNPSPADVIQMLRVMLMDRFKLAVHSDSRNGDVYDLVVARSDGRLGPMLRPSTVDCAAQRANRAAAASSPTQGPPCPLASWAGKITFTAATITQLAQVLVVWVDGREVRDRTRLTGLYDVDLTWTPDSLAPLPLNAPPDLLRAREAIDPNGPSLLTAVQEQLGLKLEPKKDKIDVLVVDRLERPTEE